MIGVGGVHADEDVHVDLMLAEQLRRANDGVERRLSALVDAIGVVHLAWSVNREADQDVVLAKELAPGVVEEHTVGLERVLDGLARGDLLDESDRAPEEIEAHEGWLAALPGDRDVWGGLCLHDLSHVRLEDLVAHATSAGGVERLLREEEAVLAVEVAEGAGRLGENVERTFGGAGEGAAQALRFAAATGSRSFVWSRSIGPR